MEYDVQAALFHIQASARSESQGYCGRYVRSAVEAGFHHRRTFIHTPTSAKNFGPSLVSLGFKEIFQGLSFPQKGDIAVIQPPRGGNAHGHVQMFDGFHWYSDFRQRDFWPGPDYRKHQPMYRLYRWTGESTEIKPSFRVTR